VDPEIDALLESSAPRRHALLSDGRRIFVKRRSDAPADFFTAEARGLAALSAANALRVPRVFGATRHAIAIEDLGSGRPQHADWEAAGRGLAKLHGNRADRFGFDADGYCGDTPQDNAHDGDGFRFFAERRLLPQAHRAREGGLLESGDVRRVEALCARLRDLLPEAWPALIHGDLWTGNLHACEDGALALIDGAAVHCGWTECDLSMLILFGAPPRPFFAAYESAAGISPDWRQRAPLLNLYHLLNHLNLFGGGYLGAVREALARYS